MFSSFEGNDELPDNTVYDELLAYNSWFLKPKRTVQRNCSCIFHKGKLARIKNFINFTDLRVILVLLHDTLLSAYFGDIFHRNTFS